MEETVTEKKKKKKIPLVIAIIVIAIAAVYIGGIAFFQKHYLPNTTVGDRDLSFQTADELKSSLEQETADYTLEITDRKGDLYSIEGSAIAFAYADTGQEEKLLKEQNAALWPLAFTQKQECTLTLSAEYDEQKLESLLDSMDFMQEENMEAPQDASIDTSDGLQIVEATEGTTVIPSQVYQEVGQAVSDLKTQMTLSDSCYESPSVTSDSESFIKVKEELENYQNASVIYTIGDQTEELNSDEILKLLTVSKDMTVSVDQDKVAAYVQSLASKYNTYAKKRKFKTTAGGTITIGGGDYGWIIDKTGEAGQLTKDLESFASEDQDTTSENTIEREPVWEQTAARYSKDGDDIGDTYIEVDYTNQHMYYYKNGKLKLDSPIVSGCTGKGNGSPDGVFKIVYKQSPATLVGEDYSSAVKYFMPFAYNVGFHDADGWRSSYGGTIYKTNGSHGCVNMPEAKVKKLYSLVEKGTPVIAYYREKIKLTAENCQKSNAYSYVSK